MFGMIVINGLITGGLYAILAIGFSLAFSTANILNLSHTSFYMIASFILLISTKMLEISFTASSIFLSIPIATVIGLFCYKAFIERIKEHDITVLIITMALAMLFQEIFLLWFKGHYRSIPHLFPGIVELFGVTVTYQQIFGIVLCFITILAIWILLSYTKLGNAMRAISQDREAANLMGINVNRICLVTIGISTGLAGIAGIAVGPIKVVHPGMWVHPLIVVLAAIVLGGLGSFKGVLVASFILGFTESCVIFLVPGGGFLKGAVALSVMVGVLMIRPEGLFGVVFEEERL